MDMVFNIINSNHKINNFLCIFKLFLFSPNSLNVPFFFQSLLLSCFYIHTHVYIHIDICIHVKKEEKTNFKFYFEID